MPNARQLREELEMTQPEAAARAGVSVATWRRWEDDPASVSSATRTKCEKVIDRESAAKERAKQISHKYEQTWNDSVTLTPRQAYALTVILHGWADTDLTMWIDGDLDCPLHDVGPFAGIDRRAMFYVDGNKAWAAKALERCRAVAKEIESGTLPFNRPGCFFDELLMAAALHEAPHIMDQLPELFEGITPRPFRDFTDDDDVDDFYMVDEEWDAVSDRFDDLCRWDEWEVPLYADHDLLPAILAERNPFNWFDRAEGTGAGYLQKLSGLVVDDTEESHIDVDESA
ncbi:helix-turn-helix domain-containing protein [Rhodococcus jostii]|nr:helix-turn-helix transcriptional regulator [Rhodococcus jostii]